MCEGTMPQAPVTLPYIGGELVRMVQYDGKRWHDLFFHTLKVVLLRMQSMNSLVQFCEIALDFFDRRSMGSGSTS